MTKIEHANGSSSTYGYNAAGHLTSITHAKAGGATLAQFNYERDAKGRLTKATETVGSSTTTKAWEYDKDGKLTKETASSQGLSSTCAYQYDAVGNRTQKDCDGTKTTYSYNNLDQLTQETVGGNATTYKYDGRGNLIEKKTPAATITYQWSSDNRLTQVSDGTTTVKYGYDALGRRISRTQETGSNKTETQWILDTARPYSEIITERTRTNGGAWSTISYTHTPDGVGLLIAENKNGNTRHIYADAQGSTRLVTDSQGNILETPDFDAFGNDTATNTKETRHRYTGESFDSATGLYHLRARDYDPQTGRFISMDEHPGSQRIPLSLNKYLYGNADPVNHIDPSGNMGLANVGISINLSSVMSNFATVLSMFSRIENAIDSVVLIREMANVAWNAWAILSGQDWQKLFVGAIQKDNGFEKALRGFDTAASDLMSNWWIVFSDSRVKEKIRKFIIEKKDWALLIYGPTPYDKSAIKFWPGVPKRIPIGRVNLRKFKRDVFLEVGTPNGKGGRMFGVGHARNRTSKDNVQWFRQDWHGDHELDPSSYCGNKSPAKGDSYHYHCK